MLGFQPGRRVVILPPFLRMSTPAKPPLHPVPRLSAFRLSAAAILVSLALGVFPSKGLSQLSWPEVRQETKPWTRWWWLGNTIEEKDLTAAMESYAAVGLGGLELTPIYGVRGEEPRFAPFLGPVFMRRFEHALREGRRLGLGIDLSTGTGWPFGGPWVGEADAAKYLARATYTVEAGARLSQPVSYVQRGVVRFAGPKRLPLASIKRDLAANGDLQELAFDQVRFEITLPLLTLQAYGPDGRRLDLTARVGADGRLDWTAPSGGKGPWRLVALFQGQHGKLVERAGPGGEGYAIDHFSAEALRRYLAPFDAAFKGRELTGLRGYFNDSYEVDDAAGESNWTPAFLDEFRRLRGYDLLDHLPALDGAGDPAVADRVRCDYRETLSDLLLERFTTPWRDWARAQGKIIRNQAHGSPALLLDLYAASDIPEQEGSDVTAIKLASSAAHVLGKPLASAEAATWLDEHWRSNLADVKAAVDLFFLGGINHVCYHGTACSPQADPWPGHQFYAAVELHPANPLWTDFAALNAYVTRAQSFLQSGMPDEDVLVYYNIHDRWSRPPAAGEEPLPHFHGRESEGVGARATAAALYKAGHGFDFVSDRMIAGLTVDAAGRLRHTAAGPQGASWRALVVPPTHLMPDATWSRLLTLVESGATVVVAENLPEDVPGLGSLDQRRATLRRDADRVRASLARVSATGGSGHDLRVARVGGGRLWLADDPAAALHAAGVPAERFAASGLDWVRRRRADGGADYFLLNRTADAVASWLPVAVPGRGAAWFDPLDGRAGVAHQRTGPSGALEVWARLEAGQSLLLRVAPRELSGAPWFSLVGAGAGVPVAGRWAVDFLRGGPVLPKPVARTSLSSWTEWGSDAARFAGTARYSIEVRRPAGLAEGDVVLDLGKVSETARVRWNGSEVAVLIAPPFRVLLPRASWRDVNSLEIEVSNLAANRIADYDRRGVPWKKFYNTNMPARRKENRGPDGLFTAAAWQPLPSGLLGPVLLRPLEAKP